VDEAEDVNDYAWTVLIPTLREEGEGWNAELWVTWNPRRKGSPTDVRFRKTHDKRYKIVRLNWRDNPKFPEVLNRQRLRDAENKPDEYDHIWEGAYGSTQGAILAKWVNKAEREGRVNDDVVFDKLGAPIEVTSDLGFRDTASFWYWQRKQGGFALLKYEGDTGLDADDWIPRIQDSITGLGGKSVGKIWLPHDARAKTFQSKRTSMERFIDGFGVKHVAIVPISKKLDQISAARGILEKCEFNKTECEAGLDGLLAWEYSYNEETQIFSREPLHNWASHPSDAFAYGAQVMQEEAPPQSDEPARWDIKNGRPQVTLDELWAASKPKDDRI
jgi:phage terminase large subunit